MKLAARVVRVTAEGKKGVKLSSKSWHETCIPNEIRGLREKLRISLD